MALVKDDSQVVVNGSKNFVSCASCTTNGLESIVDRVGGCDKEQEGQWSEDEHVPKWERPRTHLIIKSTTKT